MSSTNYKICNCISYREVVLDELVISKEEDCNKKNTHCTKKQTFAPAKIHVHEGWKQSRLFVGFLNFRQLVQLLIICYFFQDGDDIALIRLDRPANLIFVSLKI